MTVGASSLRLPLPGAEMEKQQLRKSDNGQRAAASDSSSRPKQTVTKAAGPRNIASKPSDTDRGMDILPSAPLSTQQAVKRRSGGQSVVSNTDHAFNQGTVDVGTIYGVGSAVLNMMAAHGDSRASGQGQSTTRVQGPVHKKEPFIGFRNKGLDCYANTIISILLSDPSFVKILQKVGDGHGVVTSELLRLFNTYSKGGPVGSLDVLRAMLPKAGQNWTSAAQQDAHEFALTVLEAVEDEATRAGASALFDQVHKFSYGFQAFCPGGHRSENNDAASCAPPPGLGVDNIINQTFVVVFLEDDGKVLDLQKGVLDSLKFENEAAPTGCKCNPSGQWILKPYISNAPDILAIQVARFRLNKKLMNKIDVPATLKLPAYGTDDVQYTLAASSVHISSVANVGHYQSVIIQGSKYYLIDDAVVSSILEKKACELLENSYLFYYVKQDLRESPVKKKLRTTEVMTTDQFSAPVDKYLTKLIRQEDMSRFDKMDGKKIAKLVKLFNIPADTNSKVQKEMICEAVRTSLRAKISKDDTYNKLLIQLALHPRGAPPNQHRRWTRARSCSRT